MVKNFLGGGGGQPEMQTTTQQNLPSWAIPDAMSTLSMGNFYTQNPDYRPSTLDRDYSGIRGGSSQVGQFGLNPRRPALPGTNLDGTDQYRPNDLENLVLQLPPDMQGGGLNFGRSPFKSYEGAPKGGVSNSGGLNTINSQSESTGENDGSTNSFNYWNDLVEAINNPYNEPVDPSEFSESNPPEYYDDTIPKNDSTGTTTTAEETSTVDPRDIFNPDDLTPFQAFDRQMFAAPGQNTLRGEGVLAGRYDQRFGPGGTDPFAAANQAVGTAANYQSGFQGTTGGIGGQAGNYQASLANASNPGVFQSRDYTTGLQNFANPNAGGTNVNQGVTGQTFDNLVTPQATSFQNANAGLTGTDFGNINQGLTGTTFGNVNRLVQNVNDSYGGTTFGNVNERLQSRDYANANQGLQAQGFNNANQGLKSQTFENVNQGISSRDFTNPNAGITNVNSALSNPLQGLNPINFESANRGLQGPQDFNRGFQGLLDQSFNPFQDQVVNQTIQDLDRARRISENDIRGQAAKAGAFGSREELLRAENNRNYLDRVAAATGQLRSQGFESAANRAQQENLQRLGLTAQDLQNVRGLQSTANLQAQQLTAGDRASARDLAGRGALQTQALQSQGGLQAQNLTAEGARAAQALTAQDAQQARALQSQGALAGQQLTATDLTNVRNLLSQGNLQGQQLSANEQNLLNQLQSQGGLQAQNLSATDRQTVMDLMSRGGLQGQSLTADSIQQARGLEAQGELAAQQIRSQGELAGQQLTAQDAQQVRSLISQAGLQGQNLTAADRQQLNSLISQGALQSQNLTAADRNQLNSLVSQGVLQGQRLTADSASQAMGLQSQGALAAQALQSQGALAALGANANLYGQTLGLNAGSDLAALQANAGLLSDAMGLDAADLQQRRNLASNEAQFRETANRGAGALNLQGGQALGQLAQAGTADERQRIADILAAGGAGDARNQQDLDFIYNEFQRELDYPGRQIDLRNAAISPATGSVVTTTQPRYSSGGLPQAAGAGLATYGALAGIPAAAPYALPAALAMGLLNY